MKIHIQYSIGGSLVVRRARRDVFVALCTLTNFMFPRPHEGSPLVSPGMAQGLSPLLPPELDPPLLDFLTGVGSSGPESELESDSFRDRFLVSLGIFLAKSPATEKAQDNYFTK